MGNGGGGILETVDDIVGKLGSDHEAVAMLNAETLLRDARTGLSDAEKEVGVCELRVLFTLLRRR